MAGPRLQQNDAQAPARRTQAERTALSDRRMLDAAAMLIEQHGSAGTTLKDVGEQAGYSRGLAGARFGSKSGLFQFVVRAVGDDWLRELKRATEGLDGLEALEAALDAHMHFFEEAPRHVRAFYILWFEAIGPASDVREVIARVHERRRRDVEQWLAAGVARGALPAGIDQRRIAEYFCAAVNGLVYQWLAAAGDMSVTRGLSETLKGTLRALCRNEGVLQ